LIMENQQPPPFSPTESSIPTLLQFGVNLTREAREGNLPPVVGRDEEIQLMVETICRRIKRNPLLIGAAGVGKTAIVEGFVQRLVKGDVPGFPAGATVILLQPHLILAGAESFGELEERMAPILAEATKEGVILFIDEVHTIIGAGGAAGRADIASLLKPALARGDIACIAATTDDEYRRYIESDAALERRFQPIRVQEMSAVQAFQVLKTLRDDMRHDSERYVEVPDEVLRSLIDFADRFMRNRTFPDKAVTLLDQCVANAVVCGESAIDLSRAENVAKRMVGMPLDIGARIARLRRFLAERCLLTETVREALAGRLQVTMRGLDLRFVRPNAVILLAGKAAGNGLALAEAVSEALFEVPDRIVRIDTGRFASREDMPLLLGAPPSYVGYGEQAPIHSIKQCPWCVLLLENVDGCYQGIQQVLGQAFSDGYCTDGQNRKVYLSDTLILLTAPSIDREDTLGFRTDSNAIDDDRDLVRQCLDASIADALDLICFEAGERSNEWRVWIKSRILKEVAERFLSLGVTLHWDDSVLEWIDANCAEDACQRSLENLIDGRLIEEVQAGLGDVTKGVRSITVRCFGERIVLDEEPQQEKVPFSP
jgi:ATP-dependent Clp protease ATP-binding subunit ClpC